MNLPSPNGFFGIGDFGNVIGGGDGTGSGAVVAVDMARTWVIEEGANRDVRVSFVVDKRASGTDEKRVILSLKAERMCSWMDRRNRSWEKLFYFKARRDYSGSELQ